MKKVKKQFAFYSLQLAIIFFCLLPTAYCQLSKIDSLLSLLKTDKEDTNKVNHLNKIAEKYWHLGSFGSAMNFALDALQLSEKQNPIYKKGMTTAYNNLGVIFRNQGEYPKALEYYFKELKTAEEIQNKNVIAISLGNIGTVYGAQMYYTKALDYFFKTLKMSEELNDKYGIERHLGNIGNVYEEMAKGAKTKFKIDSLNNKALIYYSKALNRAEDIGDKNGIARHLGNMGIVYHNKGDYQKAMDNYFTAMKITNELGDKKTIAINLDNIGSLYTDLKKYDESEKFLLDGCKLDKEIGALNNEMDCENHLSILYEKTNRYQLALEHYKKAMVLKDSLFSQEKNKEITRKEMTYEFEKKAATQKAEQDKQQAVAEADKKKQQVILYSVIGGLLVVLLFAGFIFRALRITQKQKKVIEEQKKLVEEKQKEILDSIHYARRIQTALLPTEKYIDKTLKRLMKNN